MRVTVSTTIISPLIDVYGLNHIAYLLRARICYGTREVIFVLFVK